MPLSPDSNLLLPPNKNNNIQENHDDPSVQVKNARKNMQAQAGEEGQDKLNGVTGQADWAGEVGQAKWAGEEGGPINQNVVSLDKLDGVLV